MIIEEMSRQECLDLLSTARQGRLACVSEGQPYVVPITFSLDGNYLYSFSMLGRKVDWMRAHPKICVQADEFDANRGWRSVVVFGTYEELPDRVGWKRDRDRAWSLLSQHANWWEPGGLKPLPLPRANSANHLFYRVVIDSLTGRRAVEEP
jgi:nitroimidazol reductase NimA-like FMN-containing flavoprotein (pyridoxamine 5'-phosphate oxidase superfamily)